MVGANRSEQADEGALEPGEESRQASKAPQASWNQKWFKQGGTAEDKLFRPCNEDERAFYICQQKHFINGRSQIL